MKLSKELLNAIIDSMHAKKMTQNEFSKAVSIRPSTISRWLSGETKTINDSTAEKISELMGCHLSDILILSMGGMPPVVPVNYRLGQAQTIKEESVVAYGSPDLWNDLAKWGRSDKTSAKAKAAVLSTAELGGFTGRHLYVALTALSTASLQDDDEAERQPAVA